MNSRRRRGGPHRRPSVSVWCNPRISEIGRNKANKLSLDYLVGRCVKAGVSVAVRVGSEGRPTTACAPPGMNLVAGPER